MSKFWERERQYQNRLANKAEGRPEHDEMAPQSADAPAWREPQLKCPRCAELEADVAALVRVLKTLVVTESRKDEA